MVAREWMVAANERFVRDYYDAVWVYGDPRVYDFAREYQLPPDVVRKIRHTGYFDQRARVDPDASTNQDFLAGLAIPPGPLAVCLVGGGQDGQRLAMAFAWADLPEEMHGVILTGPYMPSEVRVKLRERSACNHRLHVIDHLIEPTRLLPYATRVVSMGGYNSTWEILSYGKPALIVPRLTPRTEQWIRAERLRRLGLLDVLHPDHLSPRAIARWLRSSSELSVSPHQRIDLRGLERMPRLLGDVLDGAVRQHVAAS